MDAEADRCTSVSDADPGLGPTDDDACTRSGVSAFDPASSSGSPYSVKSKNSAGSSAAGFGDELPPTLMLSMKLNDMPSSAATGYPLRISSRDSAISVFRLSCPSLSLVICNQLDTCSINLIASSSVFTLSTSACRFDTASLAGSSHSVLIFLADGGVDVLVEAMGSSSRGRFDPADGSGVGALAGVTAAAGVTGAFISEGPALGLDTEVTFVEGFRTFAGAFDFDDLFFGDLGVCGGLACVGVEADATSLEGLGVCFFEIEGVIAPCGDAPDATGVCAGGPGGDRAAGVCAV